MKGTSMISPRLSVFVSSSVALFLWGCSGGAQPGGSGPSEGLAATTSPAEASEGLYAAPRPLTAAGAEQMWANLFGGYARAAGFTLTEGERELVLVSLEERGITRADVVFDGANVLVEDVVYGGEPLIAALRGGADGTVDKGKVLSQVVTQVLGVHDTTLVQPEEVVGAPTLYASQPVDDQFLFDRPEVDPGFEHVLVLADDVPEEIVAEFERSIAEIGDASSEDCLGRTFLEVLRRSEFDARFADRAFAIPPRVTEAVYTAEVCGGRSLGCTQFPHAEDVVLTAPTPEGEPGTQQRRVLVGSFIGINAAFILPGSEEFSTITHELLHALGLAHPVVEQFGNGAVAAKLVVPGTSTLDGGFPSIMAFRTTADRTFTLSPDDVDTIETLYTDAPGCEYQNAPLPISANALPILPPVVTPPASDAGAPGAGAADGGAQDSGAASSGADSGSTDGG
jgi:hypothetical protein